MATNETENELAECLSNPLRGLLDIDDNVATTSSECNYENYEEFTQSVQMDYFEQDFKGFLDDLRKKTQSVLLGTEKCDVRHVFEESGIPIMKFNLFVWHFLENGRRSNSTEDQVENAVYAACSYIALCAMTGARSDVYQIGLYNMCLKITRNCCHTVQIGDTAPRKGGAKKSARPPPPDPDETGAAAEGQAAESEEALIGPPRISVDAAEQYLKSLTTQLFAFLYSNSFSLDFQTQMGTLELIEDIGRVELDSKLISRSYRANSIREFRSLDRFIDRYCAFVHVLIESKYPTRREMAFGRLIRPRLALLPYPDDSSKTSKISTARKRAGELTKSLVISRIERNPGPHELKLIENVVMMVYCQCPDFAEFRMNIAHFIHEILQKLPYNYAYDFVQLMNVMFKGGRTAGVKSLSNELARLLITDFDFSAPDPGPVPEVDKENENQVEETAEEEEEEEAEADEAPAEKEDDTSDSEDEADRSRMKREKKKKEEEERKKKKKEKQVKDVDRIDATYVLFNIIYNACIDKSASIRLHGANSLTNILDSPQYRVAFQEFCQSANLKMDEKYGEIGSELNESMDAMNITVDGDATKAAPKKKKKATDMLQNDQEILDKFQRLQRMNRGEQRVEKDIIYMIIRQLSSDDKAPVKKSACPLLKSYLSFCDDEIKFDTGLSVLQKLCRDKLVTVRKIAAGSFTDLMLCENVVFNKNLSSKWLHSLISMLNDTDNDVTGHAKDLLMKVLLPLLERPTDVSWTLADTIEAVTNHRNYLMDTFKGATVSNASIMRNIMEQMKIHISGKEEKGLRGAWMVFSQLCVQFKKNVDFAIQSFQRVDLSKESSIVKYMIHIIENNIDKIDLDTKKDLMSSLQSTFRDFCLHSSHARSVYHCLGKLMDGIGDEAKSKNEFQAFGDELLVSCFDTIVQSFEMFKDKDEWKRNAESQERLLCTALNVSIEVFSYCPSLIPRYERLAKTLSLIVNSNDNEEIISTINPEMPSVHASRPPTQMTQIISQKPHEGMLEHEGIMFSEKVRAISVITLANMILTHDRLLQLMPTFVKQLQYNPSHQIRSNIVISIGDICSSFKTDRYAPMLAASLCDPSVIVRRHAINQIARLISLGIFRFNGEIMIRMMLATLDANEDVRNDAKLYISEVLQAEESDFFQRNFVQYMIALTQAKRIIGSGHDNEDRGQVDVAIGKGQPLARASRIAIYTFMIESLTDRHRFDVKQSIGQRIFVPIVNGEYNFAENSTRCLLEDALLIMASSEMQLKMEVGKNPDEEALEDPSPEAIGAATGFMETAYFNQYMKFIVPSILALREFLNQHRSPLQRKCLLAIRMICHEFSGDIDTILEGNRQLKDEMMFELNRVKQRSEEAHRILNDAIKRVAEFNKQQRRSSALGEPVPEEEEPVEEGKPPAAGEQDPVDMISPVRSETAGAAVEDVNMMTPKRNPVLDALQQQTPTTSARSRTEQISTPQSRLLSPSTMRKIRRSVGALIHNDMALNRPNLEANATRDVSKAPEEENPKEKAIEGTKTAEEKEIKEEPPEEEMGEVVEAAEEVDEPMMPVQQEENEEGENVEMASAPENQEEEEEESTSSRRRRSQRRKTPNYNKDDTRDSDEKVFKKPKLTTKSPAKEADISANVTIRRSRRGRASEAAEEVVEVPKQKQRKRKAAEEEEEVEEVQQAISSPPSENAENNPLVLNESRLIGGRQCSTPIRGRGSDGPGDVTFSLNLSAITEREEVKNRKSQAAILHNIFEEDEEEEEEN